LAKVPNRFRVAFTSFCPCRLDVTGFVSLFDRKTLAIRLSPIRRCPIGRVASRPTKQQRRVSGTSTVSTSAVETPPYISRPALGYWPILYRETAFPFAALLYSIFAFFIYYRVYSAFCCFPIFYSFLFSSLFGRCSVFAFFIYYRAELSVCCLPIFFFFSSAIRLSVRQKMFFMLIIPVAELKLLFVDLILC
jgi:hypothetical protein